jgi:lipoyl-dependent peroxiredoxin
MKRIANANWKGNLKEGKGLLSTESTVLHDTQYSFNTRFEEGVGTNPEELLAAAHAGCFTMAISAMLTRKGLTEINLSTKANLDFDMVKLIINGVHLEVAAEVGGITAEEFETIVKEAEKNCVISKALNVSITSEVISFNEGQ